MSNLTKDSQLLSFIEKKKQLKGVLDTKRLFFIFTKAIRNSLTKSYNKLENINLSISCSEMIYSIFWIIFSYTNNLKLTMFLCERAVILFIEYVLLSNNMTGDEPLNIVDVKIFIYKKTLGPLKIFKHSKEFSNSVINSIKEISCLKKDLLYKVFIININNNDSNDNDSIEYILENTCCILSNITYKLAISNNIKFVENNH